MIERGKQKLQIEEVLADFSGLYYELDAPEQRREALRCYLEMHPGDKEAERRQEIFMKRFGEREERDQYMRAFLNILILGRTGVHFWNRRRVERELRSFYQSLGLLQGAADSYQKREWLDFSERWIGICCQDKGYRSTVLGMVPMSDQMLQEKILSELREVCELIPEKFSFSKELKEFRESMLSGFEAVFRL